MDMLKSDPVSFQPKITIYVSFERYNNPAATSFAEVGDIFYFRFNKYRKLVKFSTFVSHKINVYKLWKNYIFGDFCCLE